jgi:hypothetical protein
MGALTDFALEDFPCNVFFETGTGRGMSLAYALNGGFKRLYSVEVDPATYKAFTLRLRLLLRLRGASLILGESTAALERHLPRIDRNDRILFFLDAHYPGEVMRQFAGYKSESDKDRRLPLERELEIIARHRANCRDVIIIDDLRIYENGPFQSGNMPESSETLSPAEKNIDFAYRLFPGRRFRKDYRNEGYLIVDFDPEEPRDRRDGNRAT